MFGRIKFIFKVIFITIFSVSLLINITLFSTSYGSLVLRYDEVKFVSMLDISSYELNYTHVVTQKENGIKLSIEQDNAKYDYHYYIDNESKITMHLVTTENNKTETYYYANGVMYKIDSDNAKTQKIYLLTQLATEHLSHLSYISSLVDSFSKLVDNDTKTKIELCFEPLYVIGVGSDVKSETMNLHLSYDLNGDLRKLSYKEGDKTYSAVITYNAGTITLPDFGEF